MGVFAYTNALPQLELIRAQMRPGDLLLLSPEFDAAKRQFCTTNAFDDAFFCMAEADYDIVARLNLQQYSGVFSALWLLFADPRRHGGAQLCRLAVRFGRGRKCR